MLSGSEPKMLDPKALPIVLGEALSPGVSTVTLINRSGLLLGCAGDANAACVISAIAASMWTSHEKVDGAGGLGCLLVECEQGRLAIKGVGSFILSCCADASVPFGLLRLKAEGLHTQLQPSLFQIGS
mmetsp:Transcript_43831/g.93292  ORF Transcript_43831/g.93292 Transcript_43831/m.93292 type:complete len:128 (-) Transcript_43831:131-514(-)|eukprot:CAMPEP_0183378772 /NCGR_PEP_ID=MMETSP0164_2-20130417/125089_1 /TAXON_ID=221442 /ORGANISM="Coccolithus pelagicus ssp braarudi, Strain PLY182g" /LENGTH=127 /DNA_ID=CAMNT_0025556345 /DNA_START=29 /DNA_END=412 /DNA_ORIENTATION=-